jgi:Tol biopolymer transport system component/DNA-binding winged helix-turn-helix (wHTH) protein
MASQSKQLFSFGPYFLDTGERLLKRGDALVPLTPKALETLIALVRQGGRVLAKEELLKTVWPDTYVEEATLAQNIFTLRKALGESQDNGVKYIETIPRRGYRFVAPVRELPYEDAAPPTIASQSEAQASADELTVPAGLAATHTTDADVTAQPLARTNVPAGEPTATQQVGRTPRPRLGAFVIGAALILILTLAVVALLKFSVRRQAHAPSLAPAQVMKLMRLPINGKVEAATISPDGKYVAYILSDAGQRSIWIRQTTATSRAEQLVAPGNFDIGGLMFARNGESLYYAAQTANEPPALYRVPAPFGGTVKRLLTGLNSKPSFSPDGRQVAFTRVDLHQAKPEITLVIADTDGGNERVLVKRTAPEYLDAPAWSPDGQIIACAAHSPQPSPGHTAIITVRVGDGVEQTLNTQRPDNNPQGWIDIAELEWLPDGSGLVAALTEQELSPRQLWLISYPNGEPRRITNDLNSYAGVSLTTDAGVLLTLQTDLVTNVWVAPKGDATRAVQVTQGPGKYDGYYGLTWTPDGRVVYASIASGAWDIWQMNADGSNPKQLTMDARSNYGPSASSDGRYIVFVSNRTGGAFHVWRMNTDGSEQKQLTFGAEENFAHTTADGRWVIYASVDFAPANYIWKVPIDGGTPVRLTDKNSSWPFPSPDGRQIVCTYQIEPNAPPKLAVFSIDGGPPQKLFDLSQTFRANTVWSPDGRAIYFLDNRTGSGNIWAQPLDGSAPRQVTDFKTDGVVAYDWSREGTLACARGNETTGVVIIKDFK